MKLDVRALAVACGLLWAAGLFVTALVNIGWPGYGRELLHVMASIYPGYTGTPGLGGAIVVALYGLSTLPSSQQSWPGSTIGSPRAAPPRRRRAREAAQYDRRHTVCCVMGAVLRPGRQGSWADACRKTPFNLRKR